MGSFRRKIRRRCIVWSRDTSCEDEVVNAGYRQVVERTARQANIRMDFEPGRVPVATLEYRASPATPLEDTEAFVRLEERRLHYDVGMHQSNAIGTIGSHLHDHGNLFDEFARMISFAYPGERRRLYQARQREKQINHHASIVNEFWGFWHRNGILAASKKVGCCQDERHAVSWQYDEDGVRRCCYCWCAYEEKMEGGDGRE